MNAWDIDPDLYASLWKSLREWYLKRKQSQSQALAKPAARPGPDAGCRS